jgi:hypothetical protein
MSIVFGAIKRAQGQGLHAGGNSLTSIAVDDAKIARESIERDGHDAVRPLDLEHRESGETAGIVNAPWLTSEFRADPQWLTRATRQTKALECSLPREAANLSNLISLMRIRLLG